jgi:hypothetical protein
MVSSYWEQGDPSSAQITHITIADIARSKRERNYSVQAYYTNGSGNDEIVKDGSAFLAPRLFQMGH